MAKVISQTNLGYVIFLSIVAATGGILFGYDTAVISGTTRIVADQFSLTTMQQGWYVGCALIGSIIGVSLAGIMSDGIGRKKTMLISAIMFSISAIGCAVCSGFDQLVVFRIIGGFGIGVVSIVSPIYISEVAIPSKRGTLVSLYQLAVTVGFLLAYLINYVILNNVEKGAGFTSSSMNTLFNTEYWRGMLGCETIPDLLFLIVIFFIPESPRWLIVKGRGQKATSILDKIYRSDAQVQEQIAVTQASIKGESKSEWKALLEPGILTAVIFGSAIAILGQFMGVNA
ncbi:MAG: MFS transporter, partial [Bacteroidales bacterium]